MSEETPHFNIDPDGEMTPPARFTYKGHQVEIVPPDTKRLIGNYWQIKIDGVLKLDCCSARREWRLTEHKN
jgi:hypothetical protein